MTSPDAAGVISLRLGGISGKFVSRLEPFAEDILTNVDNKMEQGEFLKVDKTCTVSAVNIANSRIIIKRYNYKGFLHALRQNFKISRAERCWKWGREIVNLGLFTPEPLGYIEVRRFGLRVQSYSLTEYIDGSLLSEVLKNSAGSGVDSLMQKMNVVFDKLERNKIIHRDLQARNVMVYDDKLYLIDLDAMRRTNFLTGIYDENRDRRHFARKLRRDKLDRSGIKRNT